MQLTAAIVGPAHGLRGEVIVDVRSNDPKVVAPDSRLDIAGNQCSLTIRTIHVHKDRVPASPEECVIREDAKALHGTHLFVDVHLEEDTWYPYELKGFQVRTPSSNVLGIVNKLTLGVTQDLLPAVTDRGTVMVPSVMALVPTVDVGGGFIVIDASPGLFDEDAVSEYEGD